VDNLEYGVPPVTVQHYSLKTPESTPPLGRRFLMHRLTCSRHDPVLDDTICFEQIPKRRNGPPTPGVNPDWSTGWGMHLEEGCFDTVAALIIVGFVIGGIFGLTWSIWQRDISSGFAVAAWTMSSESVAVAVLQTLLFFQIR
jgi:hypothetical protein